MKGRHAIFHLLDSGLEFSRADQTEIVLLSQQLALTRFAESQIHQNVEEQTGRLIVRTWIGGGMGIATTEDLSLQGLRAAILRSEELARLVPGGSGMLPLPQKADYPSVTTFYESTAGCGGDSRKELCARMIDEARGLAAAGNVRVALQEFAVANSWGLRAYAPLTYAAAVIIARAPDGATGYGSSIRRDVDALDAVGAGKRAAEIATRARNATSLPPGDYTVVLDPPALSTILVTLNFVGLGAFGALAAEEGRSFIAVHQGDSVASPEFSLWDDALDRDGLPMPFDAEGIPKQRVDLIKGGRAAGVCFDLSTALRAGRSSTGHALPAPNPHGPVPHSLVMPAGRESRESLIAGLRRGLLISRCHRFISLLEGPTGKLSGTTRGGTFLVEGGEIVGAVKNLRWTNAMTEAFKTVEGISSERLVEFMDLPWCFPTVDLVPSIRLGRFHIDGCQP